MYVCNLDLVILACTGSDKMLNYNVRIYTKYFDRLLSMIPLFYMIQL